MCAARGVDRRLSGGDIRALRAWENKGDIWETSDAPDSREGDGISFASNNQFNYDSRKTELILLVLFDVSPECIYIDIMEQAEISYFHNQEVRRDVCVT